MSLWRLLSNPLTLTCGGRRGKFRYTKYILKRTRAAFPYSNNKTVVNVIIHDCVCPKTPDSIIWEMWILLHRVCNWEINFCSFWPHCCFCVSFRNSFTVFFFFHYFPFPHPFLILSVHFSEQIGSQSIVCLFLFLAFRGVTGGNFPGSLFQDRGLRLPVTTLLGIICAR